MAARGLATGAWSGGGPMKKMAVLGAGITGVTTARALREAGEIAPPRVVLEVQALELAEGREGLSEGAIMQWDCRDVR